MTATEGASALPLTTTPPAVSTISVAAGRAKKKLTSPWASLVALIIAVVWTLPTFGLFISSLRPERDIKTSGWWTFFSNPAVTLDNYRTVLDNQGSGGLGNYFVNSFVIVIPSVLIPTVLATLAAYAFAWTNFRGKNLL